MRTSWRDRNRHIAVLAIGCACAATLAGAASCSLDLDESLIGQAPELDTGVPDMQAGDTSLPDSSDGAVPPVNPEGGVCATDQDCKGTAGCFAAKCDVPRKACVLQVCRQPACNSGVCDVGMAKCGAPRPYKYRSVQFPVGAPIGCGGQITRCFAAVYPFVFVGTANGVVAFAANDPLNATPASVPITGLAFVPTHIVASGSRMYFIGPPVGVGMTSSRVPLAYADVPQNPFAASIAVTSVLATHNRAQGDQLLLYPRANDTALLVDTNIGTSFASVPIVPPLGDPLKLDSTGSASTAGSVPFATSGTRLILSQFAPPNGVPTFAFVNGAGSGTPQTLTDVPIPTATFGTPPQFFAQSADGAIFWAYTSLTGQPGQPATNLRAARGYFLVADGAANFDPAAGIDLELYQAPGGAPLGTLAVGPVAMLDAKTALVTTAAPGNPTMVTNVGFVTRTPLAIVKNMDNQPRRFPITFNVNQLAAAGSNGLGYVLANDPAGPVVHVFDPACAP